LRGTASSWPELPGTTKEAAQVRSVFEKSFSNGKVTALTRDQATEQQVRGAAPRSRYLHLATHGYFSPAPTQHPLASLFGSLVELTMVSDAVAFDGDDAGGGLDRQNTSRTFRPDRGVSEVHPGLLSGIVLAGANAEVRPDHDDGVLTALEVGQLNLSKLDLVTLSACETGLGEAAGGEGLLGLQRAFQVAGARSVMASLWQVPDDATRVLMSEFFDNLWVKKLSKIEALRQAQLSVVRRYDPRSGELRGLTVAAAAPPGQSTAGLAPLYRAAFVLSGDWR
jgi:CHAT domain-containing protein